MLLGTVSKKDFQAQEYLENTAQRGSTFSVICRVGAPSRITASHHSRWKRAVGWEKKQNRAVRKEAAESRWIRYLSWVFKVDTLKNN